MRAAFARLCLLSCSLSCAYPTVWGGVGTKVQAKPNAYDRVALSTVVTINSELDRAVDWWVAECPHVPREVFEARRNSFLVIILGERKNLGGKVAGIYDRTEHRCHIIWEEGDPDIRAARLAAHEFGHGAAVNCLGHTDPDHLFMFERDYGW